LVLCAGAGAVGLAARSAGRDDSIAAVAVADKPANIAACHFKSESRIAALKPSSCNSLPGVPPRVAIWGDSHALAWQPFAFGWATAANESAASWTLDACPPALGYRGLRERSDPLGICHGFNQLVLEQVKSGQLETLILAGRWLRYLYALPDSYVDSNDGADPAWRDGARASLTSGLKATLDEVAPRVGRVIVLGPVPQLRQDAVRCLESGQARRCALSRAEFDARAKPVLGLLSALAAGHANVTVLDPSDFFCTREECPVARDGYSLYWDNNHISSTAARHFLRDVLAGSAGRSAAVTTR
ncbi:MAG: SGNH hydrolase domain-containing protein, partial [Caldimonas sp.]